MTNNDEFDPFKQSDESNNQGQKPTSENPFGDDGLDANLAPTQNAGSAENDGLNPPAASTGQENPPPPPPSAATEPEQPKQPEQAPQQQSPSPDEAASAAAQPEQPASGAMFAADVPAQEPQAQKTENTEHKDEAFEQADQTPQPTENTEEQAVPSAVTADPFATQEQAETTANTATTENPFGSGETSNDGWEDWQETESTDGGFDNGGGSDDGSGAGQPPANNNFFKQNFHYIGAGAVGVIALIFVGSTFLSGGDDAAHWDQQAALPVQETAPQSRDSGAVPIFGAQDDSVMAGVEGLPQPSAAQEGEGLGGDLFGSLGNGQTWEQPPMPTPVLGEQAAALPPPADLETESSLQDIQTAQATVGEETVGGLQEIAPPPQDELRPASNLGQLGGLSDDIAEEESPSTAFVARQAEQIAVTEEDATGRFSLNDATPLRESSVDEVAVEAMNIPAQQPVMQQRAGSQEATQQINAVSQQFATIQNRLNEQQTSIQRFAETHNRLTDVLNQLRGEVQALSNRIDGLESRRPQQQAGRAQPTRETTSERQSAPTTPRTAETTARARSIEPPPADNVRRKPDVWTSDEGFAHSGETSATARSAQQPLPTVNWVLRAAQDGTAWISQGTDGQVYRVEVGHQVAGLGIVETIRRDESGRWLIEGSQGRISQ